MVADFFNIFVCYFSLTNELCAHCGWPAQMALAFRRPPLMFLLCVYYFSAQLW